MVVESEKFHIGLYDLKFRISMKNVSGFSTFLLKVLLKA